jgi:hypothetical protein
MELLSQSDCMSFQLNGGSVSEQPFNQRPVSTRHTPRPYASAGHETDFGARAIKRSDAAGSAAVLGGPAGMPPRDC